MKNNRYLGFCPLCGEKVLNSLYSWICIENGRSCDFSLSHCLQYGFGDNRILIKLNEEDAALLLNGKPIVRELISKKGEPYKARLKLSIREDKNGKHWSNLKWDGFAD